VRTVTVVAEGDVDVVAEEDSVPGMEDVPDVGTVFVVIDVVAPRVEGLDGSPEEEHPRPAGAAAMASKAVTASVASVTSPRLFNPAPRFVRAP
jgi:hypothetical protein